MMARLLAAAAISLAASQATAGDFATLEPIGFSADGRVFAFEQHGIQDGSGFPYSEIFFLDLDADRFLAPSPIRIRLEDDGATLAEARQATRKAAVGLFAEHNPQAEPGFVAAANPPTELSADPHRIAFRPRAVEPAIDEPVELDLDLLPMEAAEHCTAFGHQIAGYRLSRVATAPGESVQVLHEDASVPASRKCPFDYRLAEVRVFGTGTGAMRAVALIGVKSVGFEGPDMRYVANPVPLD